MKVFKWDRETWTPFKQREHIRIGRYTGKAIKIWRWVILYGVCDTLKVWEEIREFERRITNNG